MQTKGTLVLLLLLAVLVALPAVFAEDTNAISCPANAVFCAYTNTNPNCTETDNGVELTTYGELKITANTITSPKSLRDECFNTSISFEDGTYMLDLARKGLANDNFGAGPYLMETTCEWNRTGDANGITYFYGARAYKCQYGCYQGACLKEAVPPCTDSDGGRNYFVKGTTTGFDSFGKTSQATDYCGATNAGNPQDTRYVHEYSCQPDGSRTDEDYLCPNGCENGACIKDSNNTVCTAEDAPVCGEIPTLCKMAPCPPVQKTFSNRCVAEAAGAKVLYTGECTTTPPTKCGVNTFSLMDDCTTVDSNSTFKGFVGATWSCYDGTKYSEGGPAGKCFTSAYLEKLAYNKCQVNCTTPPAATCGGIAVIPCPEGFECKLDGNYPDAGGKCVPLGTNCPQLMPPGPDYCKNGKIVTGVDERGCKYANCILPPTQSDFYKAAYWKCGDGNEYRQTSEGCRPTAYWKEMARLTCAKTATNCPAIAPTATTSASSNIVGDFVAGLFGQAAATAVAPTPVTQSPIVDTNVIQCRPGYVADFVLSSPCNPNELNRQCYAQSIDDIKAVKQKCETTQGEVLVTLDTNACAIYSCVDKNAVAQSCVRPGNVPNQKKLSCLNAGGAINTKVDENGCLTFLECVGSTSQGLANTAINKNILYDKATLLGLALKIESVKMELDGISAKLGALEKYYTDKGDANSAARFTNAKALLEGAGTKLDAVKQQIKDKVDTFTEQDAKDVRDTVRGIVEDTLKQVLFAILG